MLRSRFFEAKYVYHFWRPVSPAELTDSDWLPLSTKTAPDPSYPGAHGATSSAAATVLAFYRAFYPEWTFARDNDIAVRRDGKIERTQFGIHDQPSGLT